MMKLSQLVNSALEDASVKVASARDAEKTAGAATALGEKVMERVPSMSGLGQRAIGVAQDVGKHLGGKTTESAVGRGLMAAGGATALGAAGAAEAGRRHRNKTSSSEVVSTATEAVKFAESLEHLAMLFPKIATSSHSVNDLAGPPVLVSPSKGGTKDSPTKATSLSHDEASSQGGAKTDGMHVETFKSPYAKKAAEEILSAKIAQSEALLAAGQARAATALAKQAQAEFEAAKRAYDEEANTPKGDPQTLAVNRKAGDFPVPGGKVTDNKGMIDMTKRQAKTDDVRADASKHISEPALSAASDKGLTDNLEHTEGAKIAKVNAILGKVAARKQAASLADYMPLSGPDTASLDPEVYKQLAHRASLLSGGLTGLEGGVIGGGLGHAVGGTRGAVIGGLAGAGLGALTGYGGSRAGMGLRHMVDSNRQETKGQGVVAGKLQRTGPLSAAIHGALLGQNTMATPEEMAAAARGAQG